MCAINGFSWNDPEKITAMNTATRHRGPDDTGIFCDEHVSLGNNRLAIIDISPLGHQPMKTKDGRYTIVYNGELYNFQTLKKELQNSGVVFQSHSDTEVILELFARDGVSMIQKLIGIFTFAIWDSHEQTLTLARDHFGVKPLYYYLDDTRLVFSSEIKALFVHPIPRRIDFTSFNNYMRFLYCVGPATMFEGIKKLPPATYAVYHQKKLAITKYFKLEPVVLNSPLSELHELIRANTRQAVRSQLISDRPVGIFLSGGIDSSIIGALMAQETTAPINSFSVGFETNSESEKYNADVSLAQKTAKHFGFSHHELHITNLDVVDNFEKVCVAMDEPVSNHIQVATYLLAKMAKQHVAVVLGGDGGDEIFGGYDRYYYYAFLNQLQTYLPFLTTKKYARILSSLVHKPHLADKLIAQSGINQFFVMMSQKESHLASFIRAPYNNGLLSIGSYAPFFTDTWSDTINYMMYKDAQTWLVDESLVRTDKLTMAHGLEQRVPLLDPHLVKLAYSIPSKYKLHSAGSGKKIFKDAFASILPNNIQNQKKRGFFSPTAKWLREEPLRSFAYEILSPHYTRHTHDMFDFKVIQKILDNHINLKGYNLNTIWSLMTFQVWARHYLD